MSKSTMTHNTETDLHTILDGLTEGEHVKATWVYNHEHKMTIEGPVNIDGGILQCDRPIRWDDGATNPYLTSLEVTREEEVTVARDDEKVLHELLDSLEGGDTVTSEWGNENGRMTLTGTVRTDCAYLEVSGYYVLVVRQHTGALNKNLRSVTVRRTVVQHWEREGDE